MSENAVVVDLEGGAKTGSLSCVCGCTAWRVRGREFMCARCEYKVPSLLADVEVAGLNRRIRQDEARRKAEEDRLARRKR